MPSFDAYQKMYGGKTQGQQRKIDSDNVFEQTFYEDINTRTVYVYNQRRDTEFEKEGNLQPWETDKIPIDVKFFEIQYNSLAKDEVPYHITFKPSFDYHEVVPYYDEEIGMKYESTFPTGLFFDIPDSKGIYNRWLCVGEYRHYATQFPSYIVLPINHKLQWVHNRKKYESWCVLRSQNSYIICAS